MPLSFWKYSNNIHFSHYKKAPLVNYPTGAMGAMFRKISVFFFFPGVLGYNLLLDIRRDQLVMTKCH